MSQDELTQSRLKALFVYDHNTGVFIRKTNVYRAKAGDVAGTLNGYGYRQIMIDRKSYRAHRLAWLYFYGEWPEKHIDHINGNRSDNRIVNLRDVEQRINNQNIRKHMSSSSSGFLGVHFNKATGKWVSELSVNGSNRYVGQFSTAELAHSAYVVAKRQHHAGCTI